MKSSESALPLQTGYHSLSVAVIEVERADRAVFPASKHVPVPRKPPVKPVRNGAYERNPEKPGDQTSFRQDVQKLLDCTRCLPRFPIPRSNNLNRFDIRAWRNPREAALESGRLRRDYFQVMPAVPLCEEFHEPAAHLAMPVVNYGVPPARLSDARRQPLGAFLSGNGKTNDGDAHAGLAAPTGSTVTLAGCVSVL